MFDFFAVTGAILSGLTILVLILVPVRRVFRLLNSITDKHLELCGIAIVVTGMIVSSGYFLEIWMAWYAHSIMEWESTVNRMWTGPYAWSYWILIVTTSIIPLLLWSKRIRCNGLLLFLIALSIQTGIWFERIVILRALGKLP